MSRVRVSGPSRSDLTFSVEGQLFSQEEILSSQSRSRLEQTAQESDQVQTEGVRVKLACEKVSRSMARESHRAALNSRPYRTQKIFAQDR